MQINFLTDDELLNRVEKLDPYRSDIYIDQDDISTAKLFSDTLCDLVRYNSTSKSWYVYNGMIWTDEDNGMIVEKLAQNFQRMLLIYASNEEVKADKHFIDFIGKLAKNNQRSIMIKDSKSHNYIIQNDLDSHDELLNVQNGVINLNTFEFMEHDADLLLSKIANVSYDAEAKCQRFERFVNQVMCNDTSKVKYLQKLFGYALTTDVSKEECYMFYGSTTRNGKSTLLDTIAYMMGDYARNMNPQTLQEQTKKDGSKASPDIARLNGCRLLQASEPSKRMNFDVALLKTLLGRDNITARFLHENEFEFKPVFKLFINTNYLPLVNDDTLFSSDRIKVISFDRHFDPEEQDTTLKDRLKDPAELSGILNWCLEGLRLYREEGIEPPEAVITATAEYRTKSDKIGVFIQDCLIESPDHNLKASDVYSIYLNWCSKNGFGKDNKRNFFDDLTAKSMLAKTGTVNGVTIRNVIKGYMLSPDATFEPYDGQVPFES